MRPDFTARRQDRLAGFLRFGAPALKRNWGNHKFTSGRLEPGELNHPEITDEAFNWPLHLTRETEDEADIVEISFGGKAFAPLRRSGEEDLEEDD